MITTHPVSTEPAAVPFARAAAPLAPLPALLAALRAMDIPVSWLARSRFIPLLDATGVRAEADRTAAVTLPEDSTRTLRLLLPSVLEATVSREPPTGPPSAPSPMPGKRMSNRDALKYAQEQKALMLELTRTDLVEPPELDPVTARAIADYKPSGIPPLTWDVIAPAVRLAATYYKPPSKTSAQNTLSIVARYAAYLQEHPRPGRSGPIQAEDLVLESNIRWWTSAAYPNPHSRSTASCTVNRVARNATGRKKVTHVVRDSQEPYGTWEVIEIRRALLYQKSVGLNRASCFLGACCLGAGLNSRDLRRLRARDIEERTLSDGTVAYVIHVTAKGREREAVVMRQYEAMTRRALQLHADTGRGLDDLIIGVSEERAAIASPILARVALYGKAATIRLDVNRMRATWMVSAMSAPVPLVDLLRTAGVQSARMFVALSPYCPAPDPHHVEHLTQLLRHVRCPALSGRET
ncbi:hypothetical protein [Actinotalea subterranea]|uniref:hypothetical protein n=1 Tax=Actinotalea subterranea TaxID=2607497 RepID=UPI00165D6D75|nr:hypothetical protein [Actinotalea subterranea]